MPLENLEKAAFARLFSDGLLDIEIGVLLIITGFIPYLEHLGLNRFIGYGLFIIPTLVFVAYGKIWITPARLGKVKFGTGRLKKILRIHLIILVTTLATFIIFYLGTSGAEWAADLAIVKYGRGVMINLLLITVFAAMGYYFETPRIALYGFVFIAGEFITHALNYAEDYTVGPVAYGISGIIIFVCGIYIFANFLRKYPATHDEREVGTSGASG